MARRLKEVKSAAASSAEAKEKMMLAQQYKLLDVARPLLFIRNECLNDPAREPLVRAAESALKLWGHSFAMMTADRRKNIIRVTDPKFKRMIAEEDLFEPRESNSLFGRGFLRHMVKEAKVNRELSSSGRPGGSNDRRIVRSSGRSRYNWNTYYKQRSGGHGSSYGGIGTFANKFGGVINNSTGLNARGGYESSLCIPIESFSAPVGGRVSKFLDFWRSLTAGPWIVAKV